MRLSKVTLAFAAASMVAMPVAAGAATAAPSAKVSVAKGAAPVRASSAAGSQKARGSGLIVLVLAGAAVIAGILAATSGDSSPSSP